MNERKKGVEGGKAGEGKKHVWKAKN